MTFHAAVKSVGITDTSLMLISPSAPLAVLHTVPAQGYLNVAKKGQPTSVTEPRKTEWTIPTKMVSEKTPGMGALSRGATGTESEAAGNTDVKATLAECLELLVYNSKPNIAWWV